MSTEVATDTAAVGTMPGHLLRRWGGELSWERLAAPEPGPGEVLIDVEACGVGLTVLNCIGGQLAADDSPLPTVPGHELVGRVSALGAGADPDLLGRRVAAYFYLACGRCSWCVAGWEPRCERMAGYVGVHRPGGYAARAVLPQLNAIPLPDELDPVEATVVPDAIATPVHVCGERARITPGDRVIVIGAGGGIGAHLVQVARLHGAEVIGVDTTTEKLELLEELGVQALAADEARGARPASLFSLGAPTAVIDLVGAVDTLAWSLEVVGTGGRVVLVTTFRERTVEVDPRTMVFREAAVLGSRYARRSEVSVAAELLRRGDVRAIVGTRGAPEDVEEQHELLRAGALWGRGAIAWS